MATKKKVKVEPKEIEREVFIDLLRQQIELATKSIEIAKRQIASYLDLYNKVITDDRTYNLKYYIVGDGLSYARTQKRQIGF